MAEKGYTKRKSALKFTEFPDFGKVPPQALDEEESVLGAILIEADAFSLINEIIRGHEFFYDTTRQKIFHAMQTLFNKDTPIDMLTVMAQLKKESQEDDWNEEEMAYTLASLTAGVSTAAHIEAHANIVAEKYFARQLILVSSEIQKDAFDPTKEVSETMQRAEGKIFELSQSSHKKEINSVAEVIYGVVKRIEVASKNEGTTTGVDTGFYALNRITAGWQKSDLIIIAARPSMGKTAFVLSMAKLIAENGVPIAFFSLEMSISQLISRLIVNETKITGDKIKSGKLNKQELKTLNNSVGRLEQLKIYIDDTAALSIMEFRTKARRLVAEFGVEVIIIDYLQLMNASGMSYSNRVEEVSLISRSLKGLAKELDVPIIALSQLNRNVESRGSKDDKDAKVPQLSDLRESGAIEQDADIVCFIHRPEYYKIYSDTNSGKDLRGVAQIIIAKHRNGAVGDVDLYFASDFAQFINSKKEYDSLMDAAVNSNSSYLTLNSKTNKSGKKTKDEAAPVEPEQNDNSVPF